MTTKYTKEIQESMNQKMMIESSCVEPTLYDEKFNHV